AACPARSARAGGDRYEPGPCSTERCSHCRDERPDPRRGIVPKRRAGPSVMGGRTLPAALLRRTVAVRRTTRASFEHNSRPRAWIRRTPALRSPPGTWCYQRNRHRTGLVIERKETMNRSPQCTSRLHSYMAQGQRLLVIAVLALLVLGAAGIVLP